MYPYSYILEIIAQLIKGYNFAGVPLIGGALFFEFIFWEENKMKHNQKLLVMMLTVVMFVFCLFGVAACEPNENENDNKNEKTTYTVTFETVGGTAISNSTSGQDRFASFKPD